MKALYSLFDVESSPGNYARPPPSATDSHGIASAVVSHERIVAPNGAGFMIMPNLGDAVGPFASFQPSLTFCGTLTSESLGTAPVRWVTLAGK